MGERVWIGDDKRKLRGGLRRANELMPFRLAVWRKLRWRKVTRSSLLINI